MVAAQVEKAVFESDLLRIILFTKDRHRQFGGRSQDLDFVDVDLDLTCRQIGVFGASGTPAYLAVNAHYPFRTQRLGELKSLAVRIGYDLCEPVVVAQVYEEDPAMIADAMAPTREPYRCADIAVAKRAAGVGTVAMHRPFPERFRSGCEAGEKRMRGWLCQAAHRPPLFDQFGLDI